jgi:hypothetical protein
MYDVSIQEVVSGGVKFFFAFTSHSQPIYAKLVCRFDSQYDMGFVHTLLKVNNSHILLVIADDGGGG